LGAEVESEGKPASKSIRHGHMSKRGTPLWDWSHREKTKANLLSVKKAIKKHKKKGRDKSKKEDHVLLRPTYYSKGSVIISEEGGKRQLESKGWLLPAMGRNGYDICS